MRTSKVTRAHAVASFPLQTFMLLLGILLLSMICSYVAFGKSRYYGLRSTSSVLRIMHEHDRAIVEGMVYLRLLQNENISKWTKPTKNPPTMCLAIVTRQRAVPYIQTVVTSLLSGNTVQDVSSVDIHILNTQDNNPNDHLDLRIIKEKLPFISIHDSDTWDRGHDATWKSRESMDYAAALETCSRSASGGDGVTAASSPAPPWVVVLEEDAILAKKFIPRTLKLLSPYVNDPTVAYVKLVFSDKWDGFENQDIPTLISTCGLISAFLTICACRCTMVKRCLLSVYTKFTRGAMRPWSFTITTATKPLRRFETFLIFVSLTIIISINTALIGRQNLLILRDRVLLRGQRIRPLQKHHGAGTVAIAYPLQGAITAAAYIREVGVGNNAPNIDVLLSHDYLHEFPHLRAFEVNPPLAQHIGAYSSNKNKNQGRFDTLWQNSEFRDQD